MQTSMVDVPTVDGVADAYLVRPGDGSSHPAVLFFMDAIGLRPRLYEMAERIATHGYVVLVPNLFYREGRAPLVADLSDLLKPENRPRMMEVLMPFATSFTPAAAIRDTGAYLDFLAGLDDVAPGPVALTGYCMGGTSAVRAAEAFGDRIAATASFHGGRLVTDAPDSPHRFVEGITGELYLAHATNDHSMSQAQIESLEAALDAAGVTYRSEVYPAAHGFTMSDTAAYDRAAEDRHWTSLIDLLERALPAID
jgi:carboxymethylenebutenolidase